MTYLAAWLVAVGCADLVRPGGSLAGRRGRGLALAAGSIAMLVVWLVVGHPTGTGLGVWAALLALVVTWVLASARAVDAGTTSALDVPPAVLLPDDRPAPVPLQAQPPRPDGSADAWRRLAVGALALGTFLALAANGHAPTPRGSVVTAYGHLGLASLRGVGLGRALVVLGVLLVQIGTANVVVRIGLDAAGARSEPGVLRGGRLVGPLERLFIVGLGLAGQVTAASIVIAAKGLLRFPELQKQGIAQQRIDVVTEYFVVGSFVSWLVALLGLCLARV